MSKNVETVKNIYAAIGRGDMPFVLESLDDDVSWGIESVAAGEVPAHGILHGKQSVPKFFGAWAESGAFESFAADGFIDAGEHVFCLLTYRFAVKATGKVIANQSLQHWTLKNGKVIRWRGFEDTAATRDGYRK